MARATLITAVTTSWVEKILTADTNWVFSNVGAFPFFVRYDDGTPEAAEEGHVIMPGEGMSAAIHGAGDVWMKGVSVGSVAITT